MKRLLPMTLLLAFLPVAALAGSFQAAGGANGVRAFTSAPPVVVSASAALLVPAKPAKEESSGHEKLFDWINFLIFVVVIAYIVRKYAGSFFTGRSAAIQHDLEEGRKALEAAQAQLAAAEEKLRRLGEDIALYKDAAAREQQAERERMQRAAEEESRRVLASAKAMIESSLQSARIELKKSAAAEAIALAEKLIRERLDDDARTRLVNRFLSGISAPAEDRKN